MLMLGDGFRIFELNLSKILKPNKEKFRIKSAESIKLKLRKCVSFKCSFNFVIDIITYQSVFLVKKKLQTKNLRGKDDIYSHLESGGAPVHELYGLVDLNGGDGGIHILRHHISSVGIQEVDEYKNHM